MNIKCIENNSNNGNFTVNKEYNIIKNPQKSFGDYIISSDFIHIFADINVMENILNKQIGETFDLVFCKFQVVK